LSRKQPVVEKHLPIIQCPPRSEIKGFHSGEDTRPGVTDSDAKVEAARSECTRPLLERRPYYWPQLL